MKKIILVFFLLLFFSFLGIATWVAHSFNAETYKEQLITHLTKVTGRKVEIKGNATFTWTPFPTIVFPDFSIANQENSQEPIMLSAEQVRVEMEWSSLFKRPLVIKRVSLQRPTLLLERILSYQTNFNFPILFKNQNISEESFLDAQNELSLSIEGIDVKDGKFIYSNTLSGEKFEVDKISGTGKGCL